MKKKPVIGILLDHVNAGGYSGFPWYALRENYFMSVFNAGGTPVAIPYCTEAIPHYLSMIDGLLVPGGPHDVDPAMYGEESCHPRVVKNPPRSTFEMTITRAALELEKPFLGICAGEQVLNVVRGGTLIQHIPDTIENPENHEASQTPHLAAHKVNIVHGTLLHGIVGVGEIDVNSTHHQAVKIVGQGLRMNAVSPDGVIEGIEDQKHRFCLGVEWHPEYATTMADTLIFKYFTEEAGR